MIWFDSCGDVCVLFEELVLLERKSAGDIRLMLKTMLSDSERRQGLIQELIQSNSQLKWVHQHDLLMFLYILNISTNSKYIKI